MNVEQIFFLKYCNELTAEAWRTLIKFRLISTVKENETKMKKKDFYDFLNIYDDEQAKKIWDELTLFEFIQLIRSKKIDNAIFRLNLKKIKNDNYKLTGSKSSMKMKSFSVYISLDELKNEKVEFDVISYCEAKILKYKDDEVLSKKFERALIGFVRYKKNEYLRVTQADIDIFFNLLEPYNKQIIEQTLDVYNTNTKYWGLSGISLIKGVLKKIYPNFAAEQNKKKKIATAKKDKAVINDDFALDLVLGNINRSNTVYDFYILMNNYKKLNECYKHGLKLLKQRGMNEKDIKKYDWVEE